MVDQTYRLAHYWAKMEQILIDLGLSAHIPAIRAQMEKATGEAIEAETVVKATIEQVGYLGPYTAFGHEIQSIKGKHSGAMATAEANIRLEKWKARGLSEAQLKTISSKIGLEL